MFNNIKKINGPINIVRLEGEIEGVKKVIYIYFDIHLEPNIQTECSNIENIDINHHIHYTLKNAKKNNPNKTYDLFFEIGPSKFILSDEEKTYKYNYISNFNKYFLKLYQQIKINKNNKNNENKIKKESSNVRLHYIDIRDYMHMNFNIIKDLLNLSNNLNFNKKHFELIYDKLYVILENNLFIYGLFFDGKIPEKLKKSIKDLDLKKKKKSIIDSIDEKNKYSGIDYDIISKNFSEKIKNIYKNKNIKSKINSLVNGQFKEYFTELFNIITELLNYLDKKKNIFEIPNNTLRKNKTDIKNINYIYEYYNDNYDINNTIYTIQNYLEKIHDLDLLLYAYLIDLYLIRRILDKQYITNSIIYTGSWHSLNYIQILVKNFNFKITNYSYSSIKDLDKLNNKIKLSKNYLNLTEFLYPPELIQCSDIKSFPNDFL